jgi:two-component system nitrogen regulation response regulator GlnG
LEQAVGEKKFREDLFYRLNVVRIRVPCLRQRKADIKLLVNYFLKKFAQDGRQQPKSISSQALSILEQYSWPGNVRELENIIQRSIVMAKGEAILERDLPPEIIQQFAPVKVVEMENREEISGEPDNEPEGNLSGVVRKLFAWARGRRDFKIIPAVERELIIHALAETGGNQVQAAKLLGITRATLRKRVEKFQIKQELNIQ